MYRPMRSHPVPRIVTTCQRISIGRLHDVHTETEMVKSGANRCIAESHLLLFSDSDIHCVYIVGSRNMIHAEPPEPDCIDPTDETWPMTPAPPAPPMLDEDRDVIHRSDPPLLEREGGPSARRRGPSRKHTLRHRPNSRVSHPPSR